MFIIFAFDTFYPEGGWNDYQGVANTLDEAIKKASELPLFSFIDIVDLEKREIVWTKN